MAKSKNKSQMKWFRVDLHIHTPASSLCYLDKNVRFIDILRKAAEKQLDAIAITDHNTVVGIAEFRRRLDTLRFLRDTHRLTPAEASELEECEQLLSRILVLPGFEFTATLGFHILAIFPPETSIRKLEHILLELNVPEEKLDEGTSEIGATTDVLTAYSLLNKAGALVIAAHANSNHGVAMQDFNFGGQTKISYTQDPNLHALEVTDLASRSKKATARFYNGTKPEYPRRMHCIQGSDAHRLERDPSDKSGRLGIGDRCTEMLLPEVSFEAIKDLLTSTDFDRTRPAKQISLPDVIMQAQQSGPGPSLVFYERLSSRKQQMEEVAKDAVALANGGGGRIIIGAAREPGAVKGVDNPEALAERVQQYVESAVQPRLKVKVEIVQSQGKNVLIVSVPDGTSPPYLLKPAQVWVRKDASTVPASPEDIVKLVSRYHSEKTLSFGPDVQPQQTHSLHDPPKNGVEIIDYTTRDGVNYYTMKDLRNGSIVTNVTRGSARKLWRYAIEEHESGKFDPSKIQWREGMGIWKTYRRGNEIRYNLVQRDADGRLHVYYGVTDEGLHGAWRAFALPAEELEDSQDTVSKEPVEVIS